MNTGDRLVSRGQSTLQQRVTLFLMVAVFTKRCRSQPTLQRAVRKAVSFVPRVRKLRHRRRSLAFPSPRRGDL